jgi:D-glycero-alpha-D-manno-heptose-7-phosphate kinase
LQEIQSRLVVFYTGMTRAASTILKRQQSALAEKKKRAVTTRMVELAAILRGDLQQNRLESFGEILDEGWRLKKSLAAGISNGVIDDWYAKGRKAGAAGGKLLGAGAGGFLLFYAPPDRHDAIARALPRLRKMDMRFEPQGSRIIFVHH